MNLYLIITLSIFLAFLIFMSAVFSFSEMAISSTSKVKIESEIKKTKSNHRKKKAKRVLNYLDNYNEHITAIVIYNNITNVLSSTLATLLFSIIFNGSFVGYLVSFFMMTILIIIFGEILPKMLAKRHSENGSIFLSNLIFVCHFSMKPITKVLSKMVKEENKITLSSDEEINIAINESTKSGITSEFEKKIIEKALSLDNTKLKEVMTPLENIITIKNNFNTSTIISLSKKSSFSRFPIINEKGEVEAIFSTKQFLIDKVLDKKINLNNYKYGFSKFGFNDNVFVVFETLRSRREKIGIIYNDKNKFVGMVTIEDITEIIFGEIYDEDDFVKDGVYKLSDTSFIIYPEVKVKYFAKNYLPKLISTKNIGDINFQTWVKEKSDKKLKVNDYVTYKNIIIWIKKNNYKSDKIVYEIDIIN